MFKVLSKQQKKIDFSSCKRTLNLNHFFRRLLCILFKPISILSNPPSSHLGTYSSAVRFAYLSSSSERPLLGDYSFPNLTLPFTHLWKEPSNNRWLSYSIARGKWESESETKIDVDWSNSDTHILSPYLSLETVLFGAVFSLQLFYSGTLKLVKIGFLRMRQWQQIEKEERDRKSVV